MKKTPFYEKHLSLGAKIVEFAGFQMPVMYTSIKDEHLGVRHKAGIFDVSHMGEFLVEGDDAEAFLNYLTLNNVSSLDDQQAQYSAMCYPEGGIVDDLIIYRFEKNKYMMVVNAGNIQKDFDWVKKNLKGKVSVKNASDDYALLALQGPESIKILKQLVDFNPETIGFYHFLKGSVAGISMIISRTGYTGEPGFEFYHKPEESEKLWDALFEAGQPYGLKPAGLGARDTLRLEMKYCLYGNDIDETTNPLEAGLGWITKLDKEDFIGKKELMKIKESKPARKLAGFILRERGIPRHGYPVYFKDEEVGVVTSGTQSPSLNQPIGLAYVRRDLAKTGTSLEIGIRNKKVRAEIVKTPFVDSKPY
ncbi:MAG: glycine cleavage system aminomethyltransferase GcvT [Candidatus Neomarinimicrobiota bacterium]|nr:MAG: glycine cleavage system aminomethyltransferase GcvT [Candidatus Neomarinimicrobiota bacterium]